MLGTLIRSAPLGALAILVSGCGSDGSDGSDGAAGNDGRSALIAVVAEPAGSQCANGGSRIDSGLDQNGNGRLDPNEVTATQYACNGAGTMQSLVETGDEPPGSNCVHGGTRIDAGLDLNGNGVLDGAEATATRYVCNGQPGHGVTWVEVAGNAIQTVADTGYIVTNHVEQTVLTLPTAPEVGDVVQISGHGRGGWKLAQNAGQHVVTSSLRGGDLFARRRRVAQPALWWPLACSADCGVVAAAGDGGEIQKSTDGGATWRLQESARPWRGLAISANGQQLFAAAGGGQIYKGYDWVDLSSWDARGPSANWSGIASSADGRKVVATVSGGQIYTSTDYGDTWIARESNRTWSGVASSADGVNLIAAVRGGRLYTSTDSGVTWTARASDRQWWGVASSADGMKLVATDTGPSGADQGRVFTSTDAGITWTERLPEGREWTGVSSSADGTRIAVVAITGIPFLSMDSGATWQSVPASGGTYVSVALAADGSTLVVGSNLGGSLEMFSAVPVASTTTGTAGAVIGGQHESIALRYAGEGKFVVLSHSGTFVVR